METVGAASGNTQFNEIVKEATELGLSIGKKFGGKQIRSDVPKVKQQVENPVEPFWFTPRRAKRKLRNKTFLDFQNDVKISDVELAAREGF